MRWAAQESLRALGMERHQALVVSHRDGQPHVHVIANRVDPESGQAAGLNRSKLKLSKWAEEYERVQGKIRCPQRERNNAGRRQGKRVQDRVSRPTGRHRREEMNPQQQQRQAKIPAGRDGWGGPERERVAWQRAEERWEWEQLQRRRGKALGELEKRSKREWSALYGRHQQQREQLAKDCRRALGRFRLWRELGGKVREIGGAIDALSAPQRSSERLRLACKIAPICLIPLAVGSVRATPDSSLPRSGRRQLSDNLAAGRHVALSGTMETAS